MTLHADDLSPALRKQLGISANRGSRTSRHEIGELHLRCHTCGKEFRTTKGPKGYEHHSDTTGHARFEIPCT